MVTSGQLRENMAAALEIPEATVAVFLRNLREAGLIETGARGVNAIKLPYLSQARLLISLIVTDKPTKAVDASKDFGGLVMLEEGMVGIERNFRRKTKELIAKTPLLSTCGIAESSNFEAAVGRVLEIFAERDEHLARYWPGKLTKKTLDAHVVGLHNDGLPPLEIGVEVETLSAWVTFLGVTFEFQDTSFVEFTKWVKKPGNSVNDTAPPEVRSEGLAILKASNEKLRRYERKMITTRVIRTDTVGILTGVLSKTHNAKAVS